MNQPHEFTERSNKNGVGGFYFHFSAADAHLIRALYGALLADDTCPHAEGAAAHIETFAKNHNIDLNTDH